jgi:hypothetical protein
MKYIVFILAIIISPTSIAENIDVLALLKRDLGDQIVSVSASEIRYCPDNTCELYLSQNKNSLLATYVYLHIIHSSSYTPIYRGEFILAAKEKSTVLESVAKFCKSEGKSIKCVLESIGKVIGIKLGFGRYDEGNFCYSFNNEASTCEKL